MFNKIKALKDIRSQAKEMQRMMDDVIAEGEGAGGKVKISINGNQQVLSVNIDEELAGNTKKIEGGVKDALEDALKKMQKMVMQKMQESGGLDMFKNLGM